MNFTWDSLDQAKKNRESLENLYHRISESETLEGDDITTDTREAFMSALQDDLNTPAALSALLEFVKSVNTRLDASESFDTKSALVFLEEALELFGIRIEKRVISGEVQELMKKREEARQAKDFELADRLRDEIAALGVEVRDTISAGDLPDRKSE